MRLPEEPRNVSTPNLWTVPAIPRSPRAFYLLPPAPIAILASYRAPPTSRRPVLCISLARRPSSPERPSFWPRVWMTACPSEQLCPNLGNRHSEVLRARGHFLNERTTLTLDLLLNQRLRVFDDFPQVSRRQTLKSQYQPTRIREGCCRTSGRLFRNRLHGCFARDGSTSFCHHAPTGSRKPLIRIVFVFSKP